MPTEDKMTIDERRKYLRRMELRYRLADRENRSRLLDEMIQVTELHRKTLIRLMKGNLTRQHRQKQRGRTYGPAVDDTLRVIAESADHLCAERLTPNLVWLAEHLARHRELEVSPTLLQQLGRISVSSVRRILQRLGQDEPRLPRKGPVEANRLAREIPMGRIPWQEQEPGHFEVDLVHHGGPSSSGEYIHTLQMVDVATGWSELAAVLGRSYLVIQDAFSRILARLPFPVREIHPDNGSEFINHHLIRFWLEPARGIHLSRSRPYQKNDNRFVEQKNSTLVRAYLGYDRLDSVAQNQAINHLYDKLWLYYNFFQPVMRLQEKTVLPADDQPRRVRRRYDQARTPFDRLCTTGALTAEQKANLQSLRDMTNPRLLRREIRTLLTHLFTLPVANPDTGEDVRETLWLQPLPEKGDGLPVTLSFDRTIPAR